MSNRYVWARSNLAAQQLEVYNIDVSRNNLTAYLEQDNVFWNVTYRNQKVQNSTTIYVKIGTSYTFANGGFSVTGDTKFFTIPPTRTDYTSFETYWHYDFPNMSDDYDIYVGISNTNTNSFEYLYYISRERNSWSSPDALSLRSQRGENPISYLHVHNSMQNSDKGTGITYIVAKGSAAGTVSNASSGAYPADAGRLERWIQRLYQQASAHLVHTKVHAQEE